MGRSRHGHAAGLARQVREVLAADRGRGLRLAAREVVDGRGTERVGTALRSLGVALRPVDAGDERWLWELANEPAVRQASRRTAPIAWEDHRSWFAGRMADRAAW